MDEYDTSSLQMILAGLTFTTSYLDVPCKVDVLKMTSSLVDLANKRFLSI